MSEHLASFQEAAWIARARAGDRKAFADLVQSAAPSVYTMLYRRTRSHQDAEDLSQAAFLKAWQALPSFDPKLAPFSAWVLIIAGRLALNHLAAEGAERRRRSVKSESLQPFLAKDIQSTTEAENIWHFAERVLDPVSVTALWLRYADNHSPAHIAAVLGRTTVGVRVLLFRARRTLHAALTAAATDLTRQDNRPAVNFASKAPRSRVITPRTTP